MSAIAGYWSFDGREDAHDACARMLQSLQIYGPHASATWNDGPMAMGRALFRLLPEDRFDRQPLIGAEGRLVLVADVRLDNREELASALAMSAERRDTLCDAAMLLAAYERWGEACLDRLVGDFAFAVWDTAKRSLLLARDPIGQRPLHYHRDGRGFAFASMPKGLHALPGVVREPDEERVAEFLILLPEQGSRGFFKNIERVEPGHVVTVTSGGLTARRYWRPEPSPIRFKRAEEYAEGLRAQIDTATRARLRSTKTTVGAHLSAGLDSSIVVGTAARLLAPTGGRVVGFTAVPREGFVAPDGPPRITDEGAHAAATAAMHPNVDHVLVRSSERSPLQNLDRYFFLFDQPVLNLCNGVWVDAIADAARERRLNVLLTGALGNLSFSYAGATLLPDLLRTGRWLRWSKEALAAWRNGTMSGPGVLATSFGPYLPASLWSWINERFYGRQHSVDLYTAINPERFRELDLAMRARERAFDFSSRPRKNGFETRLWALRRVDLGNTNKGTLAGWGIDQRDPTADLRVIEYCLNVPPEQFLAGGVTRALARNAFRDRVPAMVLDERRRGQQAADWHETLDAARPQVAEELARLDACTPASRAIDLPRLHKLVDNWPREGWGDAQVTMNYRLALMRAVATGHFLRRAAGQNL